MEVTAQGTIIGTMQYMAPEQVEGREADARTDLFAFGAVLYEMMTGKKAFEGKTPGELDRRDHEGRAAAGLARAADGARRARSRRARCLAKDPEERWQTAHDLMVQLAWISRGRTEVDHLARRSPPPNASAAG